VAIINRRATPSSTVILGKHDPGDMIPSAAQNPEKRINSLTVDARLSLLSLPQYW
jgi:hypothetical protein